MGARRVVPPVEVPRTLRIMRKMLRASWHACTRAAFSQEHTSFPLALGRTLMTPKFALLAFLTLGVVGVSAQELLEERVVLQTSMGNIELAFFSDVAPITARHILENFKRGNYDTNHFFRVDRGFVAQVAAVDGGRAAPMDPYQLEVARKTVPGEFQMDVKHTRGILSMGRYDDPDSGTSSFSILLGDAPHLDGQYTVFGKIISGDETLRAMETAPTRREGIFVMPKERIEIRSTYVTTRGGGTGAAKADAECEQKLQEAKHRADGLVTELEAIRRQRLPGR